MTLRLALLATALLSAPAMAQEAAPQLSAEELTALRAEIAALRKEVADLKATQAKAAIPSWKGAPQLEEKKAGWSFKPRGRMHLDAGYISIPGAYSANRNLGFNARARRMRLGAEGTMPGGFGYKIEADFANGSVSMGDAFVSYADGEFGARLGNFETLNSLEQITSSNNITFHERAQMNDGFGNSRRLGLALGYFNKDDTLRAEAGIFTAHSIDSTFDNDGWIGASRIVYAPKLGENRLHFGVNFQHRNFASNNGGVTTSLVNAPSTNQLARYRARPFSQLTDVRFVDSGSLAAKSDTIMGVEAAGIFGPLYVTGEAQWTKVNAYQAGDVATGLDVFAGGNSAVVPTGDPSFFGGYAEIGWFLTGETRGYKEGVWGRTKVKNPLGKDGGWGALQIAARLDYLDLDSDRLKNGLTNNFTTGTTSLAAANARLGRGGTQTGYLFAVNWYPLDYLRFMLTYAHASVEGGPLAAQIKPLSTKPVDERKFGVDAISLRTQLEF